MKQYNDEAATEAWVRFLSNCGLQIVKVTILDLNHDLISHGHVPVRALVRLVGDAVRNQFQVVTQLPTDRIFQIDDLTTAQAHLAEVGALGILPVPDVIVQTSHGGRHGLWRVAGKPTSEWIDQALRSVGGDANSKPRGNVRTPGSPNAKHKIAGGFFTVAIQVTDCIPEPLDIPYQVDVPGPKRRKGKVLNPSSQLVLPPGLPRWPFYDVERAISSEDRSGYDYGVCLSALRMGGFRADQGRDMLAKWLESESPKGKGRITYCRETVERAWKSKAWERQRPSITT